jgi:cyclopropane fatty-acyl-phospholipid synthase-like methyltransferase
MSLYSRIVGHPFVYNRIRPIIVGGIDVSGAYDRLRMDAESTVLDIGCGTGVALTYLKKFKAYVGVDIDEVAIRFARQKHGLTPNVSFECRTCGDEDVTRLQPSHVVMAGLLHHLDDATAIDLLRTVGKSPRLVRAVTVDIVYLKGEWMNNMMAKLDRGKFCRTESEYHDLVDRAGLVRAESSITKSHPKSNGVKYLVMTLERPA